MTNSAAYFYTVTTEPNLPVSTTLYVDGLCVGTNTSFTVKPSFLGVRSFSCLGRPQFASDPYLNAALDEFQIAAMASPLAIYQLQRSYTLDGWRHRSIFRHSRRTLEKDAQTRLGRLSFNRIHFIFQGLDT